MILFPFLLGAALASVTLAACHSGQLAGSDSYCDPTIVCRRFFVCVAGRCQADLETKITGDGGLDAGAGGSPGADAAGGSADGSAEGSAEDGDAGGSAGDGGLAANTVCTLSQPFGVAVEIAELNLPFAGPFVSDMVPRLTADELTVVFTSDRLGNNDIFTAARPDRKSAFSIPGTLVGVDSLASESYASFTSNGLTLFLERDHLLYRATRTTTIGSFSSPAPFTFAAFSTNAGQPFILPDGSALFFESGRLGSNDLYRAAVMPDGRFTEPALTAINTPSSDEYMAVPTPDESTLYFGSNRANPDDKANFDIWVATRPSPGEAYGQPVSVAELNTPGEDLPGWVSSDGCRLYFSRAGVVGRRIYFAERAH